MPPFKKVYLFTAALLPLLAQTGSAQQVLFSDNFNGITGSSGYPATPTTGANYQLGISGRQGGSLATPTLGYINGTFTDGNEQLGNPNTLPANNLDNGVVGNNLLLANQGSVMINHDFSTVNAPVSIAFDGLSDSGDPTDWLAVMVGTSSQPQWLLDTTFAILFRQNGGTQYFQNGNGATGGNGAGPGDNAWEGYQLVLSDSAGTGSAFDGNGSLITYYENGALVGSASIAQLTSGQGYIGFDSPGSIVGIDNIVITATPEPGTCALLGGGLLSLLAIRRRKSA